MMEVKTKLCMDCGKKIKSISKRCRSCSRKGERSSFYIDGRASKKHYCIFCNKEFKAYNSNRKYCSNLCANLVRRNRIIKKCEVCDKEFLISFWKIKNNYGRFCSRKCFTKFKIKKISKKCEICGKEFFAVPSQIKKGFGRYCSKECFNKVPKGPQCGFQKGHKLWDYPNAKQYWFKKGIIPTTAFQKGSIPWNKNKSGIYSEEYLKKMSLDKKGKHFSPKTEFKKGERLGQDAAHWKNGITTLHDWIRSLNEYKEWRKAVFYRDNWICQECQQISVM